MPLSKGKAKVIMVRGVYQMVNMEWTNVSIYDIDAEAEKIKHYLENEE